uniref:Uncharacterized protein n=2 Tax=Anguilla anguilla TaxID=7936 RepID=A0A0E9RER0_ANGAN
MCTRTRARTHTHPPSQTSLLVQFATGSLPCTLSRCLSKTRSGQFFPMIRGSTASRYLPRGH